MESANEIVLRQRVQELTQAVDIYRRCVISLVQAAGGRSEVRDTDWHASPSYQLEVEHDDENRCWVLRTKPK